MKCTTCGSTQTLFVGKLHPYLDCSFDIYDCTSCNSRFTQRDASIYEELHKNQGVSSYQAHSLIEKEMVTLLKQGRLADARAHLAHSAAHDFILTKIESTAAAKNILEIGCSRGYLAGYLLASGRKVLGTDVSPTAIAAAKDSFGDHFCVAGSARIEENAPYDAIYHAGTIGCVNSPLETTRYLISLLKSGGILVFNAPNRLAADAVGVLWLTTPPPDLVTIFHPDFWSTAVNDLADSEVSVQIADRFSSGNIRMRCFTNAIKKYSFFSPNHSKQRSLTEKILRRLISLYYSATTACLPQEYGIHVILRRRIP